MSPTADAATRDRTTDGRTARRERNVDAVLDVVVELFSEGNLFPTVELVSKRSGVSVRSIYRYFTDPANLHAAAAARHRRRSESLAHLSDIGRAPLERRIEDFVAMRLRLYRGIGAAYRATVHSAPNHAQVRTQLNRGRRDLRTQFEQQFHPELSALPGPDRDAALSAGDALTQLDSIELLRLDRRLTVAQTERTLRFGLRAILSHGPSGRQP